MSDPESDLCVRCGHAKAEHSDKSMRVVVCNATGCSCTEYESERKSGYGERPGCWCEVCTGTKPGVCKTKHPEPDFLESMPCGICGLGYSTRTEYIPHKPSCRLAGEWEGRKSPLPDKEPIGRDRPLGDPGVSVGALCAEIELRATAQACQRAQIERERDALRDALDECWPKTMKHSMSRERQDEIRGLIHGD